MPNKLLKPVEYKITKPGIDQYWTLFDSTGWNDVCKFTIEELDIAIENSWYSVSAYLEGILIGFGRIISDGIHHALIVDLIISPDYQGKGIGSEILKRLLEKCTGNNIRDIQLFSAKEKFKFYEKFGFQKRAENAPGMEYKY
ncbi:GNAT family N-acetyltransferase [Aquimarina sp. MMG016]|uniref:GNAT family N-acetyltransferase n=1 Tax=Aquimarina sp. MMG016 TaxID=2822690 RepID=UPI001B3A7B9B|nr:GNAT family N-acetyltransferase [Aquimarina sp. MMG016]MBQ4821860.1 GNAT family N-acetyltransferase [Aquimarina sp. MMG016]